ncbi:MAG: peptidoglycan DD-metalloendopeptidase family protein [Pontibacterium sp.]
MNRFNAYFCTFFITALSVLSTSANAIPTESRVPGGVALVPLVQNQDTNQPPKVTYGNRRVMVISSEGTKHAHVSPWVAVFGIPLSAKPEKRLVIKADGREYPIAFDDKKYREQRLTIKNKKYVNPDPEQVARWKREKAEMVAAYTHWSDTSTPTFDFTLPAKGPFSSPFGLKRFYNNQPRSPHSGLDIAAPTGAPITAPSAGTVLAVGHYFFNGKTVILDHGQGLTTMYCHMDSIAVKVGDKIPHGGALGTIGKTGRVTGPHLHWGVSLNNVRVDPTLFVSELNQ